METITCKVSIPIEIEGTFLCPIKTEQVIKFAENTLNSILSSVKTKKKIKPKFNQLSLTEMKIERTNGYYSVGELLEMGFENFKIE